MPPFLAGDRREPRETRATTGSQPLVAVSAHDVGGVVVGIHDAESLHRVDDEQPVADHIAQCAEVGDGARAIVDEADSDGGRLVGELFADGVGGDDAVRRVERPHAHLAERVLGTLGRDGHRGELVRREQQLAGESVERVHQPVRGRRLQRDLVERAVQQLGEQLHRLFGVSRDEADAGVAAGAEQFGVRVHLLAHGGRERSERGPVQVAGFGVE